MEIKRFEYPMSVCKAVDYSGVNLEDAFVFLGGTDEERSLVCRTACVPDNTLARDDGWRMMRVQGVLDLTTGFLWLDTAAPRTIVCEPDVAVTIASLPAASSAAYRAA